MEEEPVGHNVGIDVLNLGNLVVQAHLVRRGLERVETKGDVVGQAFVAVGSGVLGLASLQLGRHLFLFLIFVPEVTPALRDHLGLAKDRRQRRHGLRLGHGNGQRSRNGREAGASRELVGTTHGNRRAERGAQGRVHHG